MTYFFFKRHVKERYCRSCFNQFYKTALIPKNCHYHYYLGYCHACGQRKNILVGLTPIGRLKVLFAFPRRIPDDIFAPDEAEK